MLRTVALVVLLGMAVSTWITPTFVDTLPKAKSTSLLEEDGKTVNMETLSTWSTPMYVDQLSVRLCSVGYIDTNVCM